MWSVGTFSLSLPSYSLSLFLPLSLCLSLDVPVVDTPISSPHDSPRGEILTLSCTLDAVPPPSVIWTLNGTELSPSNPRVTITTTDTQSELMYDNLMANEWGEYTCVATNVVGEGNATINVRVQRKLLQQ